MQQMDKWKDKIEFSLDNRQIFYSFFGLSVVGCLVFASGVMVGRKLDANEPGHREAHESMALLDAAMELELPMRFQEALHDPEADDSRASQRSTSAGGDEAEPPKRDREKGQSAPDVAADDSARPVLARAQPPRRRAPAPKLEGKFTLQMKAFESKRDAEALAERLRAHGHSARVDAHTEDGRTLHRVRVGAYASWDAGLAAKAEFEDREDIIAYVVRMES